MQRIFPNQNKYLIKKLKLKKMKKLTYIIATLCVVAISTAIFIGCEKENEVSTNSLLSENKIQKDFLVTDTISFDDWDQLPFSLYCIHKWGIIEVLENGSLRYATVNCEIVLCSSQAFLASELLKFDRIHEPDPNIINNSYSEFSVSTEGDDFLTTEDIEFIFNSIITNYVNPYYN